jgi:hypothetical protein
MANISADLPRVHVNRLESALTSPRMKYTT